MKGYSTLVFDLDGTLTDPSEGIVSCLNHALESAGRSRMPRARIEAEIGPPLDATLMKLAPDASAETLSLMVGAYRERYAETGYAENAVYPHIPGLLSELGERGFRMGVCTSKLLDFSERILTLFDLRSHFDFVDGGDIGVAKRDQLAGLLACGAIDAHAVMIGDRAVDITAAAANGLPGIGVLWGFGARAELEAAEPARIVADAAGLVGAVMGEPLD